MSEAEPLLADARVNRIAERLMLKYPDLPDSTQFVTAQRGGEFQFVVFCDYPRPKFAAQGQKLSKVAKGQLRGWEEAERERSHFANAGEDPAYRIFNALSFDLVKSIRSIRSMIN